MKKLLITLISATCILWWISQAGNYTAEQQDAYDYAYSQKITTVSSIEKANLNGQLTRIAMAKMISNFAINVLWLQPDTSKDCSFWDVSSSLDVDYNYGVTQACQLWLMWIWNDWKKSDKFDPYTTVTRAQFATAFSRALSQANWKVIENWNPYYSTHLAYLQSEWIIKDTSTPSPTNVEKRWNVMIMMQRASNEDKNIEENNELKWNSEYYYKNLDITANIWLDWKIDVLENITAYYNVEKHWIIRSIPLKNISISDINVEWQKFTTYTENWSIYIKIWDANKTIKWAHSYPISYKVDWLIKKNSKHTELYWTLVGYDFDTNIDNVKAEIILPKVYTWFTKDDFSITTDWKSKTIDWFKWTVDWSKWDRIIITYDKWLPAYEWITLAVKFPVDFFEGNPTSDEWSKINSTSNSNKWNETTSYKNYIKLEKWKSSEDTDLTISINNKSKWKMRIIWVKLWNYKSNKSANVYFGDNTMDSITKNEDNTATVKFPYPIDIKANSSESLTLRANTIWTKVTIDSILFEIEEDNYGKDYSVSKSDTTVANWEELYAEKSIASYIKLEKWKSSEETDLTISINNKSKWKMRILWVKLWNYKSNKSANVYFGDNTMDSITKNEDNTATVKFPYPIDIKANSSESLTLRANTIWTKVTIDSIIFKIEEDNFVKNYSVTKNDKSVAAREDLYVEK